MNSLITHFKSFSISNFFRVVLRLESLNDKVHKKIGRNLLAFQELENFLKTINTITMMSIDSAKGDVLSQLMEQKRSHSNKTMGILINEHLDQNVDTWSTKSDVTDGVVTSWKFQFPPDSNKAKALKTLLEQRNELVHHFNAKYKLTNIQDCKNADKFLEEQYKYILEEIEAIKVKINDIREELRYMMEILPSYIDDSMLFFVELIWHLMEISREIARKDGWASLSKAGKLIREKVSYNSTMLKDKFGSASLKFLLEKSDKFEFKTESGQVFFKVK